MGSPRLPDINARPSLVAEREAALESRRARKPDCKPRASLRSRELRDAVTSFKRKVASEARRGATGVSFLTEAAGHGREEPPFQKFLDFHLPPAFVQTAGNELLSRLQASPHDKVWLRTEFLQRLPVGRLDALQLRTWLTQELEQLSAAFKQFNSREHTRSYAEQAQQLYHATFHELTRQVSLGCVERGRLMADVWTSQMELSHRLLCQLEASQSEYKALAEKLKAYREAADGACEVMCERADGAERENVELRQRLLKATDLLRSQMLEEPEISTEGSAAVELMHVLQVPPPVAVQASTSE